MRTDSEMRHLKEFDRGIDVLCGGDEGRGKLVKRLMDDVMTTTESLPVGKDCIEVVLRSHEKDEGFHIQSPGGIDFHRI